MTASKFAPVTTALRGFAPSPSIHGLGSTRRYALESTLESPYPGSLTSTCGGSTEKKEETAAEATEEKTEETAEASEDGAKTYANGRLIELNSDVTGPGDAGEAGASSLKSDEESPEPGLTATLAQDTGVGF